MPKLLALTAHAQLRVRSRKIKLAWIEETVHNPDWIEPDPRDPSAEWRFRKIEEFDGRFLRFVCAETDTTIRRYNGDV